MLNRIIRIFFANEKERLLINVREIWLTCKW